MKGERMKQHSEVEAADSSFSNNELPMPKEGVAGTPLLIVRDVARSLRFYKDVLGVHVLLEGPQGILRFHNSWLILSADGAATDDRPGVTARAALDGATVTRYQPAR